MGRDEIRDFLIASGAVLDLPEAAAVGHLVRVRELVEKHHAESNSFSPAAFRLWRWRPFWGRGKSSNIWPLTEPTSAPRPPMAPVTMALTGAVTGGHVAVVQWLLEHGADAITATPGVTRLFDCRLQWAARYRQASIGSRRGPASDYNDGKSPLSLAKRAETIPKSQHCFRPAPHPEDFLKSK